MTTKLSTRKEVAEYFRVTNCTVRNWQISGMINPEVIVNGRPKYNIENLIIQLSKKGGQ